MKAKQGLGFGDPLEMVTPEKIRRIRRATEVYLATDRRCDGCAVRYDIVAVRGRRLECVRDAF